MTKNFLTFGDIYKTIYDDFPEFDEWANSIFAVSSSLQPRRGIEIIKTEDYEIIPRKHVIEREIKAKEEELNRLKEQKTHYNQRIDDEIKKIEASIASLEIRQKEFKKLI